MDAKDIRNIQEAYIEVVMTEGVVDSPYDRAQTDRADAYGRAQTDRADAYGRAQKKKKQKTQKEQVDLYDIILSHLLDEGYAETPEAAQVIMVNMSEEWRESIVEAEKSVEPDPFGRPGGKYGGVRKGGGYDKGYEAMKKKIKELEDKK